MVSEDDVQSWWLMENVGLLEISVFSFQGQINPGGGPPYPLPRSASGRALLKGALARGHVKRSKNKGKNGKKNGKETLDLIVTIDLVSLAVKKKNFLYVYVHFGCAKMKDF